MTQLLTMQDFGGVGIIPMFSAIVIAVPFFFPILLFLIWVFGTAASYFTILKTTGKKRFWHSLTAFSFATFISSLLIAAQNTAMIPFLKGYWVAFYIVMTVVSWVLLDRYK